MFTYLTCPPSKKSRDGSAPRMPFKVRPPAVVSLLPSDRPELTENNCQRLLLAYLQYFNADLLNKVGLEKTIAFLVDFGAILAGVWLEQKMTDALARKVKSDVAALVSRDEYSIFRGDDTVKHVTDTIKSYERHLAANRDSPERLLYNLQQRLLNTLDEITTHSFVIDGLLRNLIPACKQASTSIRKVGSRPAVIDLASSVTVPTLTPVYFLIEHMDKLTLFRTVLISMPGNTHAVVPYSSLPIGVDTANQRFTYNNIAMFEEKIKDKFYQIFSQPMNAIYFDLHTKAPFYKEMTELYNYVRTPVNFKAVREHDKVAKQLEAYFNQTLLLFIAHVMWQTVWTYQPGKRLTDYAQAVLDLLEDRDSVVTDETATASAMRELRDYITKPLQNKNNIIFENGNLTTRAEEPEKYDLDAILKVTFNVKTKFSRLVAFYKRYQAIILHEYKFNKLQTGDPEDLLFQLVRNISTSYRYIRDQLDKFDPRQTATALFSILYRLTDKPPYILQPTNTRLKDVADAMMRQTPARLQFSTGAPYSTWSAQQPSFSAFPSFLSPTTSVAPFSATGQNSQFQFPSQSLQVPMFQSQVGIQPWSTPQRWGGGRGGGRGSSCVSGRLRSRRCSTKDVQTTRR